MRPLLLTLPVCANVRPLASSTNCIENQSHLEIRATRCLNQDWVKLVIFYPVQVCIEMKSEKNKYKVIWTWRKPKISGDSSKNQDYLEREKTKLIGTEENPRLSRQE